MSTTHSFDTCNDKRDTDTQSYNLRRDSTRVSIQRQSRLLLTHPQPCQTKPSLSSKSKDAQATSTTPSSSKYLAKNPEWIDCPFCHERALSRVETKNNVGAAVASTAMSAVSVLVGAGPQWGGVRNFTHCCSRCDRKVAVKYHTKGNADVFSPEC
ncbi:hypothetical protein IFM58399_05111 [Aspergillus lentulus]|uniref:LITAF domain-containing protein n=1 Tax=Aspergillus lentulus TaxID=293939 RepID=A0ABQ0ZUR5_ASPLE|nr:uncharacterized protein IFM58399_05111 [Aspergillus lentulus]GFF38074.1 hypothetical protein IFM58399_05111 [Aspergillus lentulus]GFF46083.1 hypothetical protein IFM62136_00417 [Aspergillus lentulus]GFF63930.1 hypothetical protein IFM47457_00531 [Aspergillus lentulus]GFF65323.1 hypothetical protein IFM60648_01546 [Aspergillus lentulus]